MNLVIDWDNGNVFALKDGKLVMAPITADDRVREDEFTPVYPTDFISQADIDDYIAKLK